MGHTQVSKVISKGSRVQGFKGFLFDIPDFQGFWMLGSGYWMLDTGFTAQISRFRFLNLMFNIGFLFDVRCWTFDVRCSSFNRFFGPNRLNRLNVQGFKGPRVRVILHRTGGQEGHGRKTTLDYVRVLYISYGSVCELETQIL